MTELAPQATRRPWLARYPAELPVGIEPEFEDMLSLFSASVAKHGARAAVLYFDAVLTFSELDQQSDAFAAHLAGRVVAGDRVALCVQNDPAFVVALLGIWKAGAAAAVINPMYRRREVEHLLIDSGAVAMVCLDENYAEVVQPLIAEQTTALREVLLVSSRDGQQRDDERVTTPTQLFPGVARFAAVINAEATPLVRAEPCATDLAVLMYTSGTTGRPKGAVIQHGSLARASQTYREWVGLSDTDRILGVAPLFHITGLVGHVGASLIAGAPLVLTHRFSGDVILDAIREHRPSFTVGSVTMFNNLTSRTDVTPADFSSFRAVCSGGSPIAPALAESVKARTGLYLHNLYGMTETTGPAIGVPIGVSAPVDPTSGALAVGLPVFDTVVRINDETGREVPYGTTGEIIVEGPQVIPEYWNQPDASAEKISDDSIATGDVGFMDEQGWCYLVDRKTDMIIASGFKVWPREVEDVLYEHPAVQEAAVIGVPDGYRGETVKAFVVLRTGVVLTAEELTAFCKLHLAAYKYPRIIEFLDELPKSVTGKILRRELRGVL
jgi:long-chain acyl-CoA synthetase